MSVVSTKTFEFSTTSVTPTTSLYFVEKKGNTAQGERIYVVGNVPELGNWNPDKTIKLHPSVYPTWVGMIEGLPANIQIKWEAIKRQEPGEPPNQWEPDPDNVVDTPSSDFGGMTIGEFI